MHLQKAGASLSFAYICTRHSVFHFGKCCQIYAHKLNDIVVQLGPEELRSHTIQRAALFFHQCLMFALINSCM